MALVKVQNTELDSDLLSDAGTVNGYRSSGFSRSSLLRSLRRQSSVTRTSHMESSSYAKLSSELTAQAENKFIALMEVIASASKEATSLKTIWETVRHEREIFLSQYEELVTQTNELTTELKTRDHERSRHSTEVIDRKNQIEKLLVELAAAHASTAAERDRVKERDTNLERLTIDLRDVRESVFRKDAQYEREVESLRARLLQVESERDSVTEVSEKYHRDLNKVTRERNELATKFTEVTGLFEIAQKDVHSLTSRLKVAETQHEESVFSVDRLKEELKRVKQKSAESAKEAIEATEKYEKGIREIARIRETLSIAELERDEHLQATESLHRQIKTHVLEHDDLTGRFTDISQKYEASRREVIIVQESLRSIELSRTKDHEALERTRESLHSVTRERDELADELSTLTRRLDEHKHQSTLAGEKLRKTEAELSELHVEITSLKEKFTYTQREHEDAREKSGHHLAEINRLREHITSLELEKRDAVEARSKLSVELEQLRSEYSEVTETITTFRDDTEDMEREIDSLQTFLREAREQRERAVSARDSADKERDEYIARYEEKCRELERITESSLSRGNSYSHSHRSSRGGGELRTTRTIMSRSVSHLSEQASGHESSHTNMSSSAGIDRAETSMEASISA